MPANHPDHGFDEEMSGVAASPMREAVSPQVSVPEAEPERRIQTTAASLIRGGMWTTMANVIPQIYTIVLSIATARFLGPVATGQQSYISFVMSAVIVAVSLGLPITFQRFMSTAIGVGNMNEARWLARTASYLGLVLSLLALGVLVAMPAITYPELRTAWILAGVATAFVVVHHFVSQSLFAQQQFRLVSIFGLATGAFTVVATVIALALGAGINGYFLVGILPAAVILGGTFWLARARLHDLGEGPNPAQRLPKGLLAFGGAAYVSDLVDFMLNRRSEFFFLQAWSPPEELAIYSIGFAAVGAVAQIPAAFATVVLPGVAALAGAGEYEKVRSGYRTATRLVLHVTIPLAALSAVFGPIAIRLVYGSEYAAAGRLVLLMLPVTLLLVPIAAVALATLSGLGHIKIATICGVVALIVNLALDFVLIKPFASLGAAAASATGQLVAALLALYVARRRVQAAWLTARLIRTVACSLTLATAGLAVLQLEPIIGAWPSMLLGVMAALLAYAGSALLLRPIGGAESGPLVRAASGRVRGVGHAVARISER